jgi:hypothetical protein
MEVQAFIFTWKGHEARAAALEHKLGGLARTTVINSEAASEARHPHWVHLGEEAYFSAQWNRAVELFAGDLLFHIQADADLDDFAPLLRRATTMCDRYRLGVYEPNVDHTAVTYDTRRLRALEPQLVHVPMTDCTCWFVARDVVAKLPPVDVAINQYGWGICAAVAAVARLAGRPCVRDHAFTVRHARGRGYSSERAATQARAYLASLHPTIAAEARRLYRLRTLLRVPEGAASGAVRVSPAHAGHALLDLCAATPRAAAPSIATVAIITCHRPESLRRCLASHLAGARACGRRLQFLVLDDSRDAGMRAQNRRHLAALKAEHGAEIRYGGREQREAFAAAAGASGRVSGELLRFALFGAPALGYTCGANRNALLLDTVDELVLSVDDDTVSGALGDEVSPGLTFTGRADHGGFAFFDDAEAASLRIRDGQPLDLVGLHEALLGRTLADAARALVPGGGLHGDPIPPATLASIAAGRARIVVSQMGVLGDAGTASPFAYLLLEGSSRDRLLASEAAYRSARTGRVVLRRVPRMSVSAHPYCMAYVLGLDNRRALPPFFPVLRNSDGIFAATLRLADPDAFIGQLPQAIHHAPPEPRRWREEDIWSTAGLWQMNDLVMCALAEVGPAPGLREVGNRLVALAEQPIDVLEERVRRQRVRRDTLRGQRLAASLARHAGAPSWWASDARKALAVVTDCVAEARLPAAHDLPVAFAEPARRRLAQELLLSYGRLLGGWTELLDEARALRAHGVRLTERV